MATGPAAPIEHATDPLAVQVGRLDERTLGMVAQLGRLEERLTRFEERVIATMATKAEVRAYMLILGSLLAAILAKVWH